MRTKESSQPRLGERSQVIPESEIALDESVDVAEIEARVEHFERIQVRHLREIKRIQLVVQWCNRFKYWCCVVTFVMEPGVRRGSCGH
jgi:hypothetical protein